MFVNLRHSSIQTKGRLGRMVDQNGGKIYFIQIEIFFAEVHLVIYRNRRENKNFDVMGTLNLSANHAKPNLELVTPDSLHSSVVILAIFKTMPLPCLQIISEIKGCRHRIRENSYSKLFLNNIRLKIARPYTSFKRSKS